MKKLLLLPFLCISLLAYTQIGVTKSLRVTDAKNNNQESYYLSTDTKGTVKLKLIPGSNGGNCGLAEGGIVSSTATCLRFDVTSALYCINGAPYSYAGGNITLDAADPVYDRFDALVLTTSGTLAKITGTPALNPAIPNANPVTQLYLTAILVKAGGCPTVRQTVLWDENTGSPEWVGSSGNLSFVNFNNTANPHNLTKSADAAGTFVTNDYIIFQGTPHITDDYNAFKFFIRLKNQQTKLSAIQVQLMSNGARVTFPLTLSPAYGFNGTLTGVYQNVTIPFSAFTFSTDPQFITGVAFTLTQAGSTGFYLDYLTLQGGVTNPGSGGNYVTSTFKRNDSVFYVKAGLEYFSHLDNGTGGGGGTTYTGAAPIVVTGSVINADTAKAAGKLATFSDIKNNQQIDYFIRTDATGNNGVAYGYHGRPSFSGVPATIVQQAINELCPPGSPAHLGGGTIVLSGLFNIWGQEINIRGWTGNQSAAGILKIMGDGTAVISQNSPGNGAFNITNGANVAFENLGVAIGNATGKSAFNIYSDKITGDVEASVRKAFFKNISIGSSSTIHAGFFAENFFGMNVDFLSVRGEQYTSIILQNNSETTNYGNSIFRHIEALVPNNDLYAALELRSHNGKPMNLNSFDVVNIGTNFYGPGQPNGVGIRLLNASHNSFTHVDVEYMPKALSIEGGSRDNIFHSGYLHPDGNTKAVGIACSPGSNSNKFSVLMEADGTNAVLVADSGLTTPNSYDITLSGFVDETKIFVANTNSDVKYRRNGYTYQKTKVSDLQIDHASKGAGKILTSDASGNATWQNSTVQIKTLNGNSLLGSGNYSLGLQQLLSQGYSANTSQYLYFEGSGGSTSGGMRVDIPGGYSGYYLADNVNLYTPSTITALNGYVGGYGGLSFQENATSQYLNLVAGLDSAGSGSRQIKIPWENGTLATREWINSHGGLGGGSGTVTNIATGYGLAGGPITTTGTLTADTTSAGAVASKTRLANSVGLENTLAINNIAFNKNLFILSALGKSMTVGGTNSTISMGVSAGDHPFISFRDGGAGLYGVDIAATNVTGGVYNLEAPSRSGTIAVREDITDSIAANKDTVGLQWPLQAYNNAGKDYIRINTATAALTDGATTTWNYASNINATWTIAGNRTLAITNDDDGSSGVLLVTQDATGGRTITFPAGDNTTGVTQNTGANAKTLYTYVKLGSVRYWNATLR